MKKAIFEVDVKGFRQLQAMKPKTFILRELIANAFDEKITKCHVSLAHLGGKATIIIEDDCPEGFVDLAHAYTMFADTRKRSDLKVRGRFNMGEKEVICLCDFARIVSTKGGVEFDLLKGERKHLRKKRDTGSEVTMVVRMTKDEYKDCVEYCKTILHPMGIDFTVKYDAFRPSEAFQEELYRPEVIRFHKVFTAKLRTEVKDEETGDMKSISAITAVQIFNTSDTGGKAYIFEMGIPICEIECDYSINVMQKVPLSTDRDKVDTKYLKVLYGEVLNQVHTEISPDQSSNLWVRDGFASDRATPDARKTVIKQRFGNRALIANPTDRRSMDEAISNNFNVIYGSEMSKEEWEKVRQDGLLTSTSQMFKTEVAKGRMVQPSEAQQKIAAFCKKVTNDLLEIRDLSVKFYESPEADVRADYSSEKNELRFNVSHISTAMWNPDLDGLVTQPMLDLIIHELGHSAGMHYEQSYHDCLTKLGSYLALKGCKNADYFKL